MAIDKKKVTSYIGIPEFLDPGHEGWTLDSGRWTLDSGL